MVNYKYIFSFFYLVVFFTGIDVSSCKAQNLVPNPSFETYTLCPTGMNFAHYATPWYNANMGNTPDLYHTCAAGNFAGVPVNRMGDQIPRTGNGYAGVFSYYPPGSAIPSISKNTREYIGVELCDALVGGVKYYVEFYISLADSSQHASDDFGIYFSNTQIIGPSNLVLPYVPQVNSVPGVALGNKTGWMQVSGNFIAAGGEKYITVGSFKNFASANITPAANPGSTQFFHNNAYYYIDDIFVGIQKPTVSPDTIVCPGTNATLTAQGGFGYRWSTGSTNSTISVSPTSNTKYYVDILGICGDTIRDSVEVIMKVTPFVLSFSEVSNITCNGEATGALAISAAGGTGPYSYLWNNAATNSSLSALTAGTYSVVVTDTFGCMDTLDTTLTEPALLRAFVPTQTNVKCNGDATGSAWGTALGGTAPYKYSWSNSTTGQSVSNLPAGNIQLTVTDLNSCTAVFTASITENPVLLLHTNTLTHVKCFGESNGVISTQATGGTGQYNYLWDNGSTQSAVTNLASGIYTVTVTDGFGCSLNSAFTINEPLPLVAEVVSTQDESCSGKNDGAIQTSAMGGTGSYLYSWNIGSTDGSINNLSSGIYSLTVTDANSCNAVIQGTVHPAIALTNTVSVTDVICYGELNGAAEIIVNGGAPSYNYNWDNGDTTSAISGLAAGTYTVTVSDVNGCNIVVPITINQAPLLTLSHPASVSICVGQTYSITTAVTGGSPAYVYSWTSGETSASVSVSPTQQTVYSLTVTDNSNCTVTGSIPVFVNPLPVVTFSSDKKEACAPGCIVFTNTSPNSVTTTWQFENNTIRNGNGIYKCYTDEGVYDVLLTVTDNNGCSNSLYEDAYITIHPSPVADFSFSPQPTTVLNSTIYFANQSQNYSYSNWNFGDKSGDSSSDENPAYTYPDPGNYSVTLIVTNEFGCADTTSAVVQIDPDFALYAPNTFTPNNDGLNDIFIPVGVGINPEKYELFIFDRWGIVLFKSNNINTGWDGRVNGGSETAQIGTYVWKIKAKSIDEEKSFQYTGEINLIR